MKYNVATKNFDLSNKTLSSIDDHILKLGDIFPNLTTDGIKVDIVIRKHMRRGNIHLNGKAPSPIYYDGTLKLAAPKKPLIVKIEGDNVDKAISISFARMLSELKTYKGKHFVSDSQYPYRETLRKHPEYFDGEDEQD